MSTRRTVKRVLGLICLVSIMLASVTPAVPTVRARPLAEPRDAVQYVTMNGIRVLKVDLSHSQIRVRTIQANDSGGTETVQSMAQRYGWLAAINGDYFSYFD